MAILQSCCFWKSVRKGSYASVIYTLTYFMTSCISISLYLYEERHYLSGKLDKPTIKSFLGVSPMNVMFNMFFFGCSILGTLSSILVIIGLQKDQREFLVPWILVMFADIFVAIVHFLYVVIFENLKFEPLTAVLFTMDFFILCLNIYCLVCVVSQYQEYKAGRGFKQNTLITVHGAQYIAPTKANANIQQSKTNSMFGGTTNCTIIHEESPINGSMKVGVLNRSPFQRRKTKNTSIILKKQVKFTDDLKCCSDVITTILPESHQNNNNNGKMFIIDTLPEYSENIMSWHEQQNQNHDDD